MRTQRGRLLIALGSIVLAAGASLSAVAADYPTRPIRVVVPFSPGGGVDVIARTIAQPLSERLGQPIVIENKPGANGSIGVQAVVASEPDGYTLLVFATAAGMFPLMYSNLGYDPFKDLAPISAVATQPLALFTNAKFPANTVDELVALVKDEPGTISYAGIGVGSPQHMAGELFSYRNDLKLIHVPYKGTALAVSDVIAGHVQMGFLGLTSGMPYVENGQLKVLAVAAPKRSTLAPEVRTMAEEGYQDFNLGITYFFAAPANTPRNIIDRLHEELKAVMEVPAVIEKLKQQGYEAMFTTPEEVVAMMRAEHEKWAPVIKAAGLKAN